MQSRGQIKPVPKQPHIFEVTVPYAGTSPISEYEVLMEAHPYAALGHSSALVFHQLTDELPKSIIALVPRGDVRDTHPSGTLAEDWVGIGLVAGRKTPRIYNQPVQWITVTPQHYFGIHEYRPFGFGVRATNPERTLIDSLHKPELSGGMNNVLKSWAIARETVDINAIIQYVDRLDINVLRQRVGFVLEELKIQHPALDEWSKRAHRGGSSKLVAAAPYSETYSERWSLSLNAPVSALSDAWTS
jgi:predicted transcriptional regulator of viral defense system